MVDSSPDGKFWFFPIYVHQCDFLCFHVEFLCYKSMPGETYGGETLSLSQSPTGKVARVGRRSTEETNDDDRCCREGT